MSALSAALAPPSRAALAALSPEQREKEDSARVTRQRPVLRVCAELALVAIIRDAPERSGGEYIMKSVRDLVCAHCIGSNIMSYIGQQLSNDPSLSSLPLLLVFLKSFSRPYLGIFPQSSSKQISATSEPGTLSENASEEAAQTNGVSPVVINESEELVEKDIRDRFKKMCEGYFDNVAKKLVIEHNVSRISIFHLRALVDRVNSAYKNKTVRIMKHTFGQERYLRTDNKRTRR